MKNIWILIILISFNSYSQEKFHDEKSSDSYKDDYKLSVLLSDSSFSVKRLPLVNTQYPLKTEVKSKWNEGKWVKVYSKVSEYYPNKGLKKDSISYYNGNIPVDSIRIFYDPLSGANDSFYVLYQRKIFNEWCDYYREVTYLNYDLYSVYTTFTENLLNGKWDGIYKYYSQYSQLVEYGEKYLWLDNKWRLEYYYRLKYHENETADYIIYYDSSDIEIMIDRYIYENDKLKEILTSGLDSNILKPIKKITFNYDGTGKLSAENFLKYENNIWIDANQILYKYNSQGKILSKTTQKWAGSEWINESLVEYDYHNTVSYKAEMSLPVSFILEQNYPNPFNPSTQIKFYIPERTDVRLTVYNILGEEIITLVNEKLNTGEHQTIFNAKGLPSGVYFYRLKAGDKIISKKMILAK